MRLPIGLSAHTRDRGGLPPIRLVNVYAEQTPTTQSGVVLQSRLGLTAEMTIGNGPVRASITRDGTFGGDRFSVSGATAYRGTSAIGTITGNGPVYIANSDTEVLFCAGADVYSYTSAGFATVIMPFSEGTTAVRHVDGLFIALRAGTGEWWFSDVLDGRTWDGTNFATAESEADALRDIIILDGSLVLLGSETVEFWAKTGDAALPYTPVQQRVFKQGVIAPGCSVEEDNSFFWVGADGIVYRNDVVPKAISDDAWVEQSVASTTHRLFKVFDGRHKFICHRMDAGTLAYDITTGEIVEFATNGRDNWRAGPDMGDDDNGTIWAFGGYLDGTDPLVRTFTAGAELSEAVIINNLRLSAQVGDTGYLTGEFADPMIEVRASHDLGRTWTSWESTSLGIQGDYSIRPEWRALGMFRDPGMIFQFRVSAPVSMRITAVAVNEPYGGR